MSKKYWQHPRSLDASRDPEIGKVVARGRTREWDAAWDDRSLGSGRRSLTEKEASELFSVDVQDGAEFVDGATAQSDEEFKYLRLSWLVTAEEKPDLSVREVEAVALYLWGGRLPVAKELWWQDPRDHDGMLWELLAEHPPWTSIGDLMRPTRNRTAPNKGDVQKYVRSATVKLGTTVPGLRAFAIRGIVRDRNRAAEHSAHARSRRRLRPALAVLAGGLNEAVVKGPTSDESPGQQGWKRA